MVKQQTITVADGNARATTTTSVTDMMPGVPCPEPAGYTYTGARYVPLFSEPLEWNNQTTYEPLTIVIHQGNSYTSRQYVPIGIDIANTDFWALTGNYNAQVEQYRKEVADLATDVENVSTDLNTVKTNIYNSTLNRILWIGDSYSSATGLGNNWVPACADKLNLVLTNKAIGGTGFIATGNEPGIDNSFQQQLRNGFLELGETEAAKVKYIVVYGGTNDIANNLGAAKVAQAIIDLLSSANGWFPNAQVHIFYTNAAKEVTYTRYLEYMVAFNSATQTFQTSRFNFVCHTQAPWWVKCGALYSDDNVHPTSTGLWKICDMICSVLEGGDYLPLVTFQLTPKTEITITNSGRAFCNKHVIMNNEIKVPSSFGFTVSNNNLGTYAGLDNVNYITIPCEVIIPSDGTFHSSAFIMLASGNIYLYCDNTSALAGKDFTVRNCGQSGMIW